MLPQKRLKKDRLDKSSKICIIGCGLGGLGTALSLEKAGFRNITIFERDVSASARKEGYGLTLTYNCKGPLAHVGVLNELARRDCPSRSHYIFKVRSAPFVLIFDGRDTRLRANGIHFQCSHICQ
jgi:2-polyprenyl-6-methoxyphenol hydroxylase-like FAD-dependent oxidoreductase